MKNEHVYSYNFLYINQKEIMTISYPVYILLAGSAISLVIAAVALNKRQTPGSSTFGFMALAIAEYTFFAALVVGGPDIPVRSHFSKLLYIGINCTDPSVFHVHPAVIPARKSTLPGAHMVPLGSFPSCFYPVGNDE